LLRLSIGSKGEKCPTEARIQKLSVHGDNGGRGGSPQRSPEAEPLEGARDGVKPPKACIPDRQFRTCIYARKSVVMQHLQTPVGHIPSFYPISAPGPAQSKVHGTHALNIGVDLAGILRGTHGERRRWVGAEWGGVW